MTADEPAPRSGSWTRWLHLTTAVFTVWFLVYLYQWWLPSVLASWSQRLHRAVGVIPAVNENAARDSVAAVIKWGFPLSIGLFFVAFALFHRVAEAARTAE